MLRRWSLFCCCVAFLALCMPQARAEEDRVSFMRDIVVPQGEQVGDAVCFLCSIHMEGNAHGDVVTFLGNVRLRGNVEGDVVTFLGGVDMAEDTRIGGDCVSFGGSVQRHGSASIMGDVVAFPFILLLLPFLFIGLVIYGLRALFRRPRYPYPMPPPPAR